MSFRFTENGLRKACALVLVGTIAGGVSYGQVHLNNTMNNDFLKGYYYDEDVKKNREDLMLSISNGGSSKVKTYGKKKELVPKTITR